MFSNLLDAIRLEAGFQWCNIGVFRPLSRTEYAEHGSIAGRLYARR